MVDRVFAGQLRTAPGCRRRVKELQMQVRLPTRARWIVGHARVRRVSRPGLKKGLDYQLRHPRRTPTHRRVQHTTVAAPPGFPLLILLLILVPYARQSTLIKGGYQVDIFRAERLSNTYQLRLLKDGSIVPKAPGPASEPGPESQSPEKQKAGPR